MYFLFEEKKTLVGNHWFQKGEHVEKRNSIVASILKYK